MEEQNTEITKPEVTEVKGQAANGENKEPIKESNEKTSYWVMGLFLVIFLICGGLGYCPWWVWIVLVLWVFATIGGLSKKWQAILGVVVLVFGTPIFSDDDSSDSYSGSYSSSSSYSSGSSSSSGGHAQTESERREIEADFYTLQQLQQRFENAYSRHDMDAAKRISDEAMNFMQRVQQKNLTEEQRRRLQAMF